MKRLLATESVRVSTDSTLTQLVDNKTSDTLIGSPQKKVSSTEDLFFNTEDERQISPVDKALTLESSKSESIDFDESIESETKKIIEVKVPKSDYFKLRKNIIIPKDIKAINELGGIQIKGGSELEHDVLDRNFEAILKGKFILQCSDEKGFSCWIGGGKNSKPYKDYTVAKLYASESRMKLAIPKLENKYSLSIEARPAIDFLRNLSKSEREEILRNWGIEFSFVDE